MLCVTFNGCETFNQIKLEDFSVDMNSPQITIGEVDLQIETMLGMGKIKKINVAVSYFPREDAVCLKYKFEFYNYYQFWNRKGRLGFINALQNYNIDYDARNLQRNSGKSLQKYGAVRGYLVWQMLDVTVQARANMNVELGYTFKEKSPYFTIYQREAEYYDEFARDNNRVSPNITLFFTRAQAAELAELFEQYISPEIDIPDDDDYEDNNGYVEFDVPAGRSNIPKDAY
jgi:hypothetical protein